jgi:indolepyruvate ferredoxin oxidoreductase alpha subunit
MAERSFVEEVKKLRLGAGEVFRGEGILAVTKALLESGSRTSPVSGARSCT